MGSAIEEVEGVEKWKTAKLSLADDFPVKHVKTKW